MVIVLFSRTGLVRWQCDKYLHFRISLLLLLCLFWHSSCFKQLAFETAADMLIGLDIQTLALKCMRLALVAHVLLLSQTASSYCSSLKCPAKWPGLTCSCCTSLSLSLAACKRRFCPHAACRLGRGICTLHLLSPFI